MTDRSSQPPVQPRYQAPREWSVNRRGETVGALGSSAFLSTSTRSRFVLSADLMRPDGVQGLVVGLDRGGDGYVLLTRMDFTTPLDPADPRAPINLVWMHWRNHPDGPVLARRQLQNVDGINMVRRDARVVLPSVVMAWLLAVGSVGIYGVLAGLYALIRRPSSSSRAHSARTTKAWPDRFALAAIAVSFVLTTFVSRYLEVIPHITDSTAYLFQAKTLAEGHLWVPTPKHPAFFYQPFIVVDHGRWFSKYPPGWPLLLAIGVRLGVPWLVDPVLSAGTLGLVYLTGRRIYGMRVALLATVMLTTSPLFLGLGGSFMAHTSALFFLAGFTYLFVRWVQQSELHGTADPGSDWKLLLPAGLSLGIGFSIREFDVLPLLLPCAWLAVSQPSVRRLQSCLWIGLGAAVPAALLALYNARLTGNVFTSPYTLWWSFDRLGFGAHVGSYRFTVPISLWHTSMNLEMLQADLFGWPFYAGLALVSTPFLLGRAIRWDSFFAISALVTVVAYGFYFNPGGAYLPRYYFSAFPAFALLAARGVQELGRLPSRVLYRGTRRDGLALTPPLVLVATCLLYSVGASLPAHVALLHDYAGVTHQRMDVVDAAHIHHAVVFVEPLHATPEDRLSPYMSTFSSNTPTLDGDVILSRDLGARDTILMRAFPNRAYYRLRQFDPELLYFRWRRLDEMRWEPLRPVFRLTKLTAGQPS
ncbi:MAG: hypothetical protein PVSMB7_21960 [Chloroflexota bacterium]